MCCVCVCVTPGRHFADLPVAQRCPDMHQNRSVSLGQNFRRLWWSMNNCGRCSADLPKCPQISNRKYVSLGKISAASSVCIGIRRWGKGVKNNFQASDLYKLTSHLPTTGARWNLCSVRF